MNAIVEDVTCLIDDPAGDERWPAFSHRAAQETWVRSMLSFRLFVQNDTIGALNLYSRRAATFDEHGTYSASRPIPQGLVLRPEPQTDEGCAPSKSSLTAVAVQPSGEVSATIRLEVNRDTVARLRAWAARWLVMALKARDSGPSRLTRNCTFRVFLRSEEGVLHCTALPRLRVSKQAELTGARAAGLVVLVLVQPVPLFRVVRSGGLQSDRLR